MSEFLEALFSSLVIPIFLVIAALVACGTTLYQCSRETSGVYR